MPEIGRQSEVDPLVASPVDPAAHLSQKSPAVLC